MDSQSIDKIINTLDNLPKNLPNISTQFVLESKKYWQSIKNVFFDDSGYYCGITSEFDSFSEYQKWYAKKAISALTELSQSDDWSLKYLTRNLVRHYNRNIDGKVITPFPLKQESDQLYLILPDNSRVKTEL
tara:strand:+ start:50 stop:445 length:396 start_codon:yes stop_codon:yes gene_type:complete